MRRLALSLTAPLLVCACASAKLAAPEVPMDETLIIGQIVTLDPAQAIAGAALVRGSRFACVGSAIDCARKASPRARTVELGRGSAVPGLADAHGHVLSLGRSRQEVSCAGVSGPEECAERVRARAKALPAGQWVRGSGWDQNAWPGAAFPTESVLTSVVPDRPVALLRVDGHALWVNLRALEVAGIGDGTPDPDGGKILHYPDGRPSGVLVDNAMDLVLSGFVRPSEAEIEQALVETLGDLAKAGLTSVHDAGVSAEALEVYRKLAEQDRLPLRVYAMIDGQVPRAALRAQMDLWRKTPEVGRLTVRAVKLFADGALGSRGAALFKPYADDPATSGLFLTPPDELRERILLVAEAGFQPAVHAIGDRACAETLLDFAAAGRKVDLEALRPRVEHLQVLLSHDAHLLKETWAVASMQPGHAVSDSAWVVQRLGAGTARLRGAYAWRQVLDFGVPLAFGSDFPVESASPLDGLYAAETRRRPGLAAFHPEQAVSRDEALRAYTAGAAFASFAEGRRGAVQVGYDADLTAFEQDILTVPAERLPRVPIAFTMVGGRIEFSR